MADRDEWWGELGKSMLAAWFGDDDDDDDNDDTQELNINFLSG